MTGYERVEKYENYYFISAVNNLAADVEYQNNCNDNFYDNANYYSDETVAENNARADKLMRQLRRFAVEHNDCELDWSNEEAKFYIFYNYDLSDLVISYAYNAKNFGQIYFSSRKIAEQAVEKFKDELIWYFTEYCDHVVENKTTKRGCELCNNDNLSNVGINDNRIALWGGNNKPEKEQKLKYCPNCGRKLED